VKWKKSNPGVYKINVDASFRENENNGATGLIVRDHTGTLVRAQAKWYDQAASPLTMEAEAIRDAVCFAVDRGYQRVIIESDAQEVVKCWRDPRAGRSIIASIIQEIKELSDMFTSFNISYVSRLANQAAHSCANKASSERRRCLWLNYTPPFLVSILEKDYNDVE
jgi:ribonuclease HI